MISDAIVRRATLADASAIASVHREAWQWAYRGLIPDAFLDGLSAPENQERRAAMWRRILADADEDHRSFCWAAEDAGRIVGFASGGPSRDDGASADTGEVGGLYLDRAYVGRGVGRALFAAAADELRRQGYRTATLWVLASNHRARRFYEATGWRPDGTTKTEERPGFVLDEVRYRARLDQVTPSDRGR